MATFPTSIYTADNGGRRRTRDRRFLICAMPPYRERRTNWERRSGVDRRLRHVPEYPEDRRMIDEAEKVNA